MEKSAGFPQTLLGMAGPTIGCERLWRDGRPVPYDMRMQHAQDGRRESLWTGDSRIAPTILIVNSQLSICIRFPLLFSFLAAIIDNERV